MQLNIGNVDLYASNLPRSIQTCEWKNFDVYSSVGCEFGG